MPFSHEALDGYPNAEFFRYDDAAHLAEQMKGQLMGKKYVEVDTSAQAACASLLERMMDRV